MVHLSAITRSFSGLESTSCLARSELNLEFRIPYLYAPTSMIVKAKAYD